MVNGGYATDKKNAAIFAAQILGIKYPEYQEALEAHREVKRQEVLQNAVIK